MNLDSPCDTGFRPMLDHSHGPEARVTGMIRNYDYVDEIPPLHPRPNQRAGGDPARIGQAGASPPDRRVPRDVQRDSDAPAIRLSDAPAGSHDHRKRHG